MSGRSRIRRSPFEFMTTGMKVLAAIVVALTLVVSGLLVWIAVETENGNATPIVKQEVVQFEPDDIRAPEGSELIGDEANPLSSGLDPAMPFDAVSFPLLIVVGVGIVVVGAYFGVSTCKLNANISKMKDSIR